MSVKSAGYAMAGVGLCGAAVIPGTVGKGFIAVGTKLLSFSSWLSEKGNEYKKYSQELDEPADETVDETVDESVDDKKVVAVAKPVDETVNAAETGEKVTVVDEDNSEKNPDAVALAATLC